ncbi:MarR family winged helix-turn-helix transcriptional regulator [Propionicimonas sp.]|uniref:MarR family winged helix-turn-helix transcriptional regulator n=1 Tax=Propionicimonas sp. TaxID=1955623 RepID=UPI0039E63170
MATNEHAAQIAELIGRIAMRSRQNMATAMDQVELEGLTPHQARILGWIEANEERGVIQRDIADVMGSRAASVSSLLQVLERDGWIERRTDPSDSRRKSLYTTPKGRARVRRFESDIWAGAGLHLDSFTDAEADDLRRLLAKLDQELAD